MVAERGGNTDHCLPSAGGDPVFVARQPIFDRCMSVIGYELLYRGAGPTSEAVFDDAQAATAQVLMLAAMDLGLDRLVGRVPAYVNCPAPILARPACMPGPGGRIVIEVLESVTPEPAVIEGLQQLRRQGHVIALDDFQFRAGDAQLLEIADIVKLDLQAPPVQGLAAAAIELKRRGKILIAEKVETLEQFNSCLALGFDSFQGYFLQRPETFSGRRAPVDRIGALQLLTRLHDPDVAIDAIEPLVTANVALSYRILRHLNSAYLNLGRHIRSIHQAIVMLGLERVRQLCALIVLAGFNDRPGALIVQALVRARMCELLAARAALSGAPMFFMTGLLSLSDALLGVPLPEAIETLPLADVVRDALLDGVGMPGAALGCCRAFETGHWFIAEFPGLAPAEIAAVYLDAVSWADGARANPLPD